MGHWHPPRHQSLTSTPALLTTVAFLTWLPLLPRRLHFHVLLSLLCPLILQVLSPPPLMWLLLFCPCSSLSCHILYCWSPTHSCDIHGLSVRTGKPVLLYPWDSFDFLTHISRILGWNIKLGISRTNLLLFLLFLFLTSLILTFPPILSVLPLSHPSFYFFTSATFYRLFLSPINDLFIGSSFTVYPPKCQHSLYPLQFPVSPLECVYISHTPM